MNCNDFEISIMDLARHDSPKVSASAEALSHAGACPACAARLAEERELTALLQRAAAEPCAAPARIETALLAAWRTRRAEDPGQTSMRGFPRYLPAAAWGIAAVLTLALLGSSAFKMLRSPVSDHSIPSGPAAGEPATAPPAPARGEAAGTAPVSQGSRGNMAKSTASAPKQPGSLRPAPRKSPATVEIATDFISLTPDAGTSVMESGQLVRVLLPRSAMASYGLPVNEELADKPVTAQVLIGQDGIARAIRFLGATKSSFVQTGASAKR